MKALIAWFAAFLLLDYAAADQASSAAAMRGATALVLGRPTYLTIPGLTCGDDAQKKRLLLDGN